VLQSLVWLFGCLDSIAATAAAAIAAAETATAAAAAQLYSHCLMLVLTWLFVCIGSSSKSGNSSSCAAVHLVDGFEAGRCSSGHVCSSRVQSFQALLAILSSSGVLMRAGRTVLLNMACSQHNGVSVAAAGHIVLGFTANDLGAVHVAYASTT
jgi:hypothetical protein